MALGAFGSEGSQFRCSSDEGDDTVFSGRWGDEDDSIGDVRCWVEDCTDVLSGGDVRDVSFGTFDCIFWRDWFEFIF